MPPPQKSAGDIIEGPDAADRDTIKESAGDDVKAMNAVAVGQAVSSGNSLSVSQPRTDSQRKLEHEVWLHIYDLNETTGFLNDWLLRPMNSGLFHCGVEVLGTEWFFAWGATSYSGVHCNSPRMHSVHVYKESVCMGTSALSSSKIESALATLQDTWPECSYHPIEKNCVTFAEAMVAALRVPEPFPVWVRGAADVGKNRLLFPVADFGWRTLKRWLQEPDEETMTEPLAPSEPDAKSASLSWEPAKDSQATAVTKARRADASTSAREGMGAVPSAGGS